MNFVKRDILAIKESKIMSLKNIEEELKNKNDLVFMRFFLEYFTSFVQKLDYGFDVAIAYEFLNTLKGLQPKTNEQNEIFKKYIKILKELVQEKQKKLTDSTLMTEYLTIFERLLSSLELKFIAKAEEGIILLKGARGIKKYISEFSIISDNPRVDMRNRNVITIDCSNTLIRDDAFSIEKKSDGTIELGIYITDVSAIAENSPLDNYAFSHFSTLYTKNNWIPIIPDPLVYKFSLNEGIRNVMAFTYRLDSKLNLIDCDISLATINVKKNLSYDEAAELLRNSNDLYSILKTALEVSEVLSDSLGTIDRYHRIKEFRRELEKIEIPEKHLNTPGTRIVSTFAIFLNNYIATEFSKSKLPFIYRVNNLSNNEIEAELKKVSNNSGIVDLLKLIKSLYQSSTFSSINTGHKGLGLDAYTQATSPARLYPALLVQRMLIDLYVRRLSFEDYAEKYKNVEEIAKKFTFFQERNYNWSLNYSKSLKKPS